jgi:hypothetical protein
MSETKVAIMTGITGLATTMIAWYYGGKQKAKTENQDAITRGTDAIVNTSNKLLEMVQDMLNEERQHRVSCEKSLQEHKSQLDQLAEEIKELRTKI